jgi:uncharacterized membrane protein
MKGPEISPSVFENADARDRREDGEMTETTFISHDDSRATATPRGRPIHRLLVSFSAAYFTAALVTDLAYWQTLNVLWERFSIWLIVAGLIFAGLAAVTCVIGLASNRQIERPPLFGVVGYVLAVLLSVVNAFVHSRDAYTAVVPTGLMLSGLVVVVLLLTAWVDAARANRSRVGG